jgi:Mg2+/citrate symporter
VVALGLVLIVLSGLLTAGVVLSNTDPVAASAFGVSLSNVSLGGLFLVGAITGVVFGLGLAMMLAGATRRRAKRVGLKRDVKDVRHERENLAEENARLQEELERERTTHLEAAPVYPDTPASGTTGRHAVRADVPAESSRPGLFRR